MRDYLTELNEQQYEAVTSESQYLRIIAGAGSGKTRVLTYRIAYLLEEKLEKPWNILAITFTNKVAAEMKERAAKLVEKNIKELSIKTFHSFCAYFLRHEITYTLGYPSSFIIYDEDDSKDKIKEACVAYGLEKKDKLVGEALNYIYAMKGLGKYPNDIKLNQGIFRDEKKLLDIYKIYESLKFDDKALDFDDLILKTIEILKNFDDVRFKWQRYYRHILIDEFQDTNDLQYELVNLLMTPQTSLYVVGDPDQTIYTWRGANQNIILDLNKKYPSLRTIILKQNYRSTKTILDCSNLLINHNKYRVKKDLVTDNEKGADIDVFSGFTRNEEADWVSRKIIELKAKNPGFSFNDVAVLFRNSYLSSSFENKFTMSRIPYVIYGGIRFYQRKEVKIALSYFRLAVNLDEDFSFYKIINEPKRKIGDQTVLLIQDESKSHGLSAYSYIKNIENYPETKLKFSVLTSLNVMIKKLEDAHERLLKKDEAVVAILKDLIDEIGLEEYLLTLENGEERIQNLRALFDQLTSFFKENDEQNLEGFLENIALASSQDEIKEAEKVKMMTIHTAKGLEFKYVFVVGVNEKTFPSQRTLEENPHFGLEEERRLCYVAFTRARKRLYVTCNRDFSFVSKSPGEPSRFFQEAGLTFYKKATTTETMKEFKFMSQRNHGSIFGNTQVNPKPVEKNNKSSWHVNEHVKHNKFGVGKIIEIVGDILVIDFAEHGIKKILSYYVGLEKANVKEVEL
jgi:DNA helicase-2/ATP-dependent DNA helicase PcrA